MYYIPYEILQHALMIALSRVFLPLIYVLQIFDGKFASQNVQDICYEWALKLSSAPQSCIQGPFHFLVQNNNNSLPFRRNH